MSQINKIGVIGAGNMGSGIAQKMAQEGLNVVMVDIKEEFVQKACCRKVSNAKFSNPNRWKPPSRASRAPPTLPP
jgi:3-hydroxyacyl-CoA dehydrogenase